MTQWQKILSALREGGPGTSSELAAETGLPMKHCCAWLRWLAERGYARKTGKKVQSISVLGYPTVPAHVYEACEGVKQ